MLASPLSATASDLPQPPVQTVRLVLAENMDLMRCALTSLLGAEPDLSVIAALECDAALVDKVLRLQPDVVVVDVDERVQQCLAAIEKLRERAPMLPIVALAPAKPPIVRRLLTIRVTSVIDRNKPPARLLEAIRAAASGDEVVDVALAVAALAVKPNPLTAQETEVLRHAAEGATGPEIAAQMHLSQGTVRNYLSKAALKTSARGRVDAVRIAQEAGWL